MRAHPWLAQGMAGAEASCNSSQDPAGVAMEWCGTGGVAGGDSNGGRGVKAPLPKASASTPQLAQMTCSANLQFDFQIPKLDLPTCWTCQSAGPLPAAGPARHGTKHRTKHQ